MTVAWAVTNEFAFAIEGEIEMAHTPGPWKRGSDEEFHHNTLFGPSGEALAQCFGIPLNCRLSTLEEEGRWEEGLANAHLIASAPELLESLKDLRSLLWTEGYADSTPAMAKADALIAKVEAA
jgi:hypothetical protein